MSDELAHLEKDLLGQLRKMQDYLAALEAQNNELILQNNSLEAQNLTLRTAQNKIIERQFELTTQNDALKRQNQALLGQLNDAKTYQSDVMTQNKQLRESLKLSESQILKLTKQLSEVQDQPPTPSMTTHDEQELLDLIDKKDALIETLEQTVLKMRESLSMLNV